jgi:hypothetical protein
MTPEEEEALAVLTSSFNIVECPHCGQDLVVLGQQKVWVSAPVEPSLIDSGSPLQRPQETPLSQNHARTLDVTKTPTTEQLMNNSAGSVAE